MTDRAAIRKEMRALRSALSQAEQDAAAQAVLELLDKEDLREKLGTNALAASKTFSAEHMACCYCNVYTN